MFTDGSKTQSHRAWQNELGRSFSPDTPEQVGLTVFDNTPPEPTLEQRLARQKSRVRQDAEVAYAEPVTDASGRLWNGGFDSASKIKGAADLAEFAGLDQIRLYDLDNAEHVVTLNEAKQIAATIGGVFQTKLAAKQAAMRALAAIDLDASDAKVKIEEVTWAGFYSGA